MQNIVELYLAMPETFLKSTLGADLHINFRENKV